MNYHHYYHTANFADVFKHLVLIFLIEALLRKEKPFCYLDTHAGIGLYDLQHPMAQKTREYMAGLVPVLQAQNPPNFLRPYLDIIASYNVASKEKQLPRYYPGSPCIVKHFLRAHDRIIVNDLLPANTQALQDLFHKNKQVLVQQMDAYQALKALLPPLEKRGLVLIDPAYEQPDEFKRLIAGLKAGLARWATGIYAIWYPIKDRKISDKFIAQLKAEVEQTLLVAEMTIYAEDVAIALNGCGMAIINPPWQLDEKLNLCLSWLWQTLSSEKKGGYRVFQA